MLALDAFVVDDDLDMQRAWFSDAYSGNTASCLPGWR